MAKNLYTDEEKEIMRKIYGTIPNKELYDMFQGRHTIESITVMAKKMGLHKPANKWTEYEVELLKNNYSKMPLDEIALLLNNKFSNTAIICKASKLKLKRHTLWTLEDIKILINNFDKNRDDNIENIISLLQNKFTKKQILTKAYELDVDTNNKWTEEETYMLLNCGYETIDKKELEKIFGRKFDTILSKAIREGLHREVNRKWTKEEDDYLIDNIQNMAYEEIATSLNRSVKSIQNRKHTLGIKLEPKYSSLKYRKLSLFLRSYTYLWRCESMKNCLYKDVITGEKFDDVHHVVGFNTIINEVLDSLNIDIAGDFSDFTDDELRMILEKFIEVHSKYPLGVCLSLYNHKMFHYIFGYGHNTKEQWEDFLLNYNKYKQEYDSYIEYKTA